MRKTLKRSLSFLLALTIIFSSAYVGLGEVDFDEFFAIKAKAATNIVINGVDIGYSDGSYFTKNGKSCANSYWSNGRCHKNGVCETATSSQCNCMRYWPTGNPSTCTVDLRAAQCFGFARYCQFIVYGYYDLSKPSYFTDITGSISSSNCTAKTLKSKLLNCSPATHVRTKEIVLGYGHSISIVSTSDYGANVADCNSDGYCKVRYKTYSWDELASYLKSYGGVDYSNACNKGSSTKTLNVYFNANGGKIDSDTYKLSSNFVCNISDGSKKYQPWVYNNKKSNGLVNYGTLGLYKTGYKFVGWGTKASGGTIFDQDDTSLLPTDINANVANGNCSTTLYAIWEPNTLKVYFNANGGSISSDEYILKSSIVCNKSDSSKKYQPWVYNNKKTNGLANYTAFGLYRTGYKFVGWGTTSSGGTVFDQNDVNLLPATINSNLKNGDCSTTLYAIWEPNTLNVYYNANGGSINSESYKISSNIVCNISDGSKVAQIWTYNNKKPAGLYNCNSMGLYKTGYTFAGWGTTSSGGTIFNQNDVDLLPTAINKNLKNGNCSTTLYAIWVPNKLTVYFNANGASISSDTYKLTNDVVCNVSDNSKLFQTWTYNNSKTNGLMNHNNTMGLYKTGYTFVGWGTAPDGGTVFSQSDSEMLPTDISLNINEGNCSTTLYAIWIPNELTVYFNANGGSIDSDTYKLTSDSVCNISDGSKLFQTWVYNNPKTNGLMNYNNTMGLYKTGHTFVGWGTTSDGVKVFSQSDNTMLPTDINSNVKNGNCETTLYAIWKSNEEEHSYTVEGIITEPTCTTTGLKKLSCSVHTDCGKYKEVEIPAVGHSYGEWETTIYPTCVTIGSKVKSCTCGDTITESIDVLEHNYSEEWTIDAEPSCTVDGSKSHHCINENCTEKTEATAIPASGHDYGDWQVIENSTCAELGLRTKSCKCGDVYSEDIPLADCVYSDVWTIDKEATCIEDGSKSHHCLVCDNKVDVMVIPATGHDYVLEVAIYIHPHTKTYKCSFCQGTMTDTQYMHDCVECNFSITAIDSSSYKLVSYIGTEKDVVIPGLYNERVITTVANSCFKGNTAIESVKIADGVTTIGSLVFMNCVALKKVTVPASVTSIGTQAFYGFTGTMYCEKGSYAHEYAVANNIDYVLVSILETEYTQIDYNDNLIFTSIETCMDIFEVLDVTKTTVAIPTASHISGNVEFYGTGTVVTVFDSDEYIGDFTMIVNGDTNGDSVCDALDAAQVALVSNGQKTIDGAYKMAADSNSDDIVDIEDYQAVVNQVVA